MWTQEYRRIYRREADRYPSDLRNAEWARLEPLIPKASPGGRPPNTDMRAAMNAILYLLRTGCPWRYLPHDRFPLRPMVYNIFRKFRRDGILRERMGREASPSAAVLDARSVKSANRQNRGGNDNQVGYNAGKQVKGGKVDAWSIAKGCRCGSLFIPP